jgi:hypothetical protein
MSAVDESRRLASLTEFCRRLLAGALDVANMLTAAVNAALRNGKLQELGWQQRQHLAILQEQLAATIKLLPDLTVLAPHPELIRELLAAAECLEKAASAVRVRADSGEAQP